MTASNAASKTTTARRTAQLLAALALAALGSEALGQMGVRMGNTGALGANGPSALRSGVMRGGAPAQSFSATARFGRTFHGGGFHRGFPSHFGLPRGFDAHNPFFPSSGTNVRIGLGGANDSFRLGANIGGGSAAALLHHDLVRHQGQFVSFNHGFPVVIFGSGFHHGSFGYPYGFREPYRWGEPVGYSTTYQDPRLGPGFQNQGVQAGMAPEAREPTTIERARLAMAVGDTADAIDQYREHLGESPADGVAMRELAMALLEEGRIAEGVALIRHAYELSPELASDPIDARALGRDARDRLGGLVRRVSIYANQGQSSSGWLAITALIQAEGRTPIARLNLERAILAGLEPSIGRAMGRSLGIPEPDLRRLLEAAERRGG